MLTVVPKHSVQFVQADLGEMLQLRLFGQIICPRGILKCLNSTMMISVNYAMLSKSIPRQKFTIELFGKMVAKFRLLAFVSQVPGQQGT